MSRFNVIKSDKIFSWICSMNLFSKIDLMNLKLINLTHCPSIDLMYWSNELIWWIDLMNWSDELIWWSYLKDWSDDLIWWIDLVNWIDELLWWIDLMNNQSKEAKVKQNLKVQRKSLEIKVITSYLKIFSADLFIFSTLVLF